MASILSRGRYVKKSLRFEQFLLLLDTLPKPFSMKDIETMIRL